MKDKRGISMIALIITIIVIIILSTIGISHTTNVIENAQEASYKQELSEVKNNLSTYYAQRYLYTSNWFDSLEMYWEGGNSIPVNTIKMDGTNEDSIEKILGPLSKTMKNDLRIFNGELKLISVAPEKHINWAAQLGVITSGGKVDVLNIPPNAEVKYKNSFDIKCENGKIILNGKMPSAIGTSGNNGFFIKISNELFVDSTSTKIPVGEKESLGNTKVGDKITLLTNRISGSYEINNPEAINEFNICLRNAKNEAAYKIEMLKENVGASGTLASELKYAYIFLKGDMTFDNYVFTVQVLKDVDANANATYSNLGIRVGEIEDSGLYGVKISVDKDNVVTVDGKVTNSQGNLYVLLNQIPYCVDGSANGIPEHLDTTKNLAVNGDNVTLSITEMGGTATLHGKQFNVTLRGAIDGVSTLNGENMLFLNKNGVKTTVSDNQFNCKVRDNIYSCSGTVSTGPAYCLGLFLQNGTEFDNYKVKINFEKQ